MIFHTLYASAQAGELMLIDGGYCRYHLRRDGQLTIYEIISLQPGAGSEMLRRLCQLPARIIVARCPASYASNAWYQRRDFALDRVEVTKAGEELNVWAFTVARSPSDSCTS